MRRVLVQVLLAAACASARAQIAPDSYWVRFTDKASTPYSLNAPEEFLSARSIARRQAQGIALDETDLPIDPAYIAGVLALGDVQLLNRCKWLNAITVRITDPTVLQAVQQLPYVLTTRAVRRLASSHATEGKFELAATAVGALRGGEEADYGASWTQISMLNGQGLHAMEAKGQGMLIGVLDSGFDQADALPAFDALWGREGVLLTCDLVDHDGDVFGDHWHGRSVLSCMAGMVAGELQGTAPSADYVLVRTEDADTEYLIEEDNWVAGAELCDSLGCDVLNTSLGYTEFDDAAMDHAYGDLDGATTRISIAAGMASRKGMIPVVSAGNQGSSAWYHIGAPADAIDILTVGAVGAQRQSAPFSSRGPSADGRVKPDVCAMGWGAIGLGSSGTSVDPINGTSFSSPILAGLVACLWQLHPQRTAHEVMDAVRRSADLWGEPNDSLGYGIPDFMQAHALLTLLGSEQAAGPSACQAFPVPFQDRMTLRLAEPSDAPVRVCLRDPSGRTVLERGAVPSAGTVRLDGLERLAPGAYVLSVATSRTVMSVRVIKD